MKKAYFLCFIIGPAEFKSEGDLHSPISLPNAPAFGSGDGGIDSLFALKPKAKEWGASLPEGGG